jgi:hypothetical protein
MTKRPSLAESMKAMATASAPPSDTPSEPPRPAIISAPLEARKFRAATREGLKKVTTAVEPAQHKQLKRLAVDSDKSVEDLLREAIDDLLAKHH